MLFASVIPNVVDIGDPTAVAWAGVGAVVIVSFLLRVFEGIAWVKRHPLPATLIVSEVGAFIFGAQVIEHWQTLLAQGILVAMGATGLTYTMRRVNGP